MSEIRVNKITNRSGLGTVTVGDAGAIFSGEKTGLGTDNPRYTVEVGAVGAGGTQLWVNGDARVTGIMSIGQGTITLDPDSNMIKLGALTMHRDSGTGDAILMNTGGTYNPFRASKFLIDATEVIDNNRNFTGVNGTFSGNVSVGGTLTYEDVTNIDSVGVITARSGIRVTGGSVGIGTDSMSSALQIYAADTGEGTAKGQITLKDTAAYNQTPTGGIVFQGHHTAGAQAIFAGIRGFKANTGDGDYDGCLAFDVRTHGAVAYEAMRINEDGKLMLGTTTPGFASYGDRFTISTSSHCGMTIRGGSSQDCELFFADSTTGSGRYAGGIRYAHATDHMQFTVNAAERLRITSDGDVRLVWSTGTFLGEYYDADYYMGLSFGASSRELYIDNRSNDTRADIVFRTILGQSTPSERLRILSNGDMGLGTSSPNFSSFGSNTGGLEISGVNTNNALLVQSGSNEFFFANSSTTNYIWGDDDAAIVFGTNDTEKLRITSGGNVQVNGGNVHIDDNGEFAIFEGDTSLAMTNSSKISMDFASNVARIRSSHNGSAVSRPLAFFIGSSEKLRIASNGTVIAGATSVSGGNRSQYSILAAVSNNTSATGHGVFTIQAGANSSSGNEVAQLCFSDPQGDYAWIQAFADAATGSSDKPGRLVFSTTADGGTVPTERLRITSGGNVNIGGDYTQTGYKAQITGDLLIQKNQAAYQHPQIELYNYNTGGYGGAIKFTGNLSGTKYTQATIRTYGGSNTSDGSLAFFTGNGTEKVRIDSSGGVSIGTGTHPGSSDVTLRKDNPELSLVANPSYSSYLMMGDINDYDQGMIEYDNTNADQRMRFVVNTSEAMRISHSGNLYIGKTTSNYTSSGRTVLALAGSSNALLEMGHGTTTDGFFYAASDEFRMSSVGAIPLIFHTDSTERLRIDSVGRIGVNVTPSDFGSGAKVIEVHSSGSVNSFLALTNSTTGSGGAAHGFNIIMSNNEARLFNRENGDMTFWTNSTERLRITAAGRNLIGGQTASEASHSNLQVREDGFGRNVEIFRSYESASTPARIRFSKSRGSAASPTIVASGDNLAEIRFNGYDGTNYDTQAAQISAAVDGTPGVNDMPGRLVFSTTADGASSPTERLRIDSSGVAYFKNDSGTLVISSTTGNDGGRIVFRENTLAAWSIDSTRANAAFSIKDEYNSSERLRIDNSGRVNVPAGDFKVVHGNSGFLFQEFNNGATIWLDGADGDFTGGDYYGIHANNSGELVIGYAGGSSWKMDSSGRVINPSQPIFSARRYSASGSLQNSMVYPFRFSAIDVNYGSHFNNSTGLFTAPVTGNYLVVSCYGRRATYSAWGSNYILVNGGIHSFGWTIPGTSTNATYQSLTVTKIVPMVANDVMAVGYYTGYTAPLTGTDDNSLSIYLVG